MSCLIYCMYLFCVPIILSIVDQSMIDYQLEFRNTVVDDLPYVDDS
jgi:hypothetical protein